MDFDEVDQILIRHGLDQEPAFDQVGIEIRPIPDMNGCPLGLYYPDSGNIVIPPDGYEGVLLHELGHRHGHYYYDNLSEPYAEDYRRRFQKGSALMYSGRDFDRLPRFGELFQEGERGMLALAFSSPLYDHEVMSLQQELARYSQGEAIPRLTYSENGQPTLTLHFQKGVDWFVITGAVMAGTFVGTFAALGYAVYKIADTMPWVVPVTLFGIVSVLGLRALSRKGLMPAIGGRYAES